MTKIRCECDVCVALAGLPEPETTEQAEQAYESLPHRVRRVLGAMGRAMRSEGSDEDVRIVEGSARRCQGATFRGLTRH